MADPRRDNHARIYAEWHRAASERDGAALIALYTDNAITKPLRGSRDQIDRGEFLLRDRYHIGHSLFAGLAGHKACERRSCFRGCANTLASSLAPSRALRDLQPAHAQPRSRVLPAERRGPQDNRSFGGSRCRSGGHNWPAQQVFLDQDRPAGTQGADRARGCDATRLR